MQEDFWTYLMRQWQVFYFMSPFVLACQITALIICLKYWRNDKIYFRFFGYIITGIILFAVYNFAVYSLRIGNIENQKLPELLNVLFLIIEFLAFSAFLYVILKSPAVQAATRFFSVLFFAAIILLTVGIFNPLYPKKDTDQILSLIGCFELMYIGFLCLLYFYKLFKMPPAVNLSKSPSFWIISFSVLYTIVFPPITLLFDKFRIENKVMFRTIVALHYFSLGFVYIGITKAFLCKKPLTS